MKRVILRLNVSFFNKESGKSQISSDVKHWNEWDFQEVIDLDDLILNS